jgi:hypothetical protein
VHIDWATLAEVAVVAAAAAVTVVLLISYALVALSARTEQRAAGSEGVRSGTGTAVAVLCVLAVGLIVGYGLYLITAA